MIELRIGGMPLLDDKGRMVTDISAIDIRSLGAVKPEHYRVLNSCVLSPVRFPVPLLPPPAC